MECTHFLLYCILVFCSDNVASHPQIEDEYIQGEYQQTKSPVHQERHLPPSDRLNDQIPPQQQWSDDYQRQTQQYYSDDYQSTPQQYQNDNFAQHSSANIKQQGFQDPTPFVNPPRRNYDNYGYEPRGYQSPTLQRIHSIPSYEGSYQDYRDDRWTQNPYLPIPPQSPINYPAPSYPYYGHPYAVPHVPVHSRLNNPIYPANIIAEAPAYVKPIATPPAFGSQKHPLQTYGSKPSIKNKVPETRRYLIVHPNGTYEHLDKIDKIRFPKLFKKTSNDKPHDAIFNESTKRTQTEFYKPEETPTYDTGIAVMPHSPEWRRNNGNYANYAPRNPFFRPPREVYQRREPINNYMPVVNERNDINYFKPEYALPIEATPVKESEEVSEKNNDLTDPKELQANENLNPKEQQYDYSEVPTTTDNPAIVKKTNDEGKYHGKVNELADLVPPKDESKTTFYSVNPETNVYVDVTTESQLDKQPTNDYNDLNKDTNIATDYQHSLNKINVENDLQDREPTNSNPVNEYNYDVPSDVSGTKEAVTSRDYNESPNTEKLDRNSGNKVLETSTISLENLISNNLSYEKEVIANNASLNNSPDEVNVDGNDVTGPPEFTSYYGLTTSKPKNTSDYFEIDVANLKNDDRPIVWFRPDPEFWDKVTQGNETFDVVYFMNVKIQPVIERYLRSSHYENGTEVVETMETHWKHEGDPAPKVVKTTRNVRHPEHPEHPDHPDHS